MMDEDAGSVSTTTQFHVTGKYFLTGFGTVVTGYINGEPGVIRPGDRFLEDSSGTPVAVVGVDLHPRETEIGTEFGLSITEDGAEAVKPGSVLVQVP